VSSTIAHKPGTPLFSWSIILSDDHLGKVGVTNDQSLALEHICEALRNAPAVGARGLLHKVTPCLSRIAYYYDNPLTVATVSPSGTIVFAEFPPRGTWGQLDGLMAGYRDVLGYTLPPEAVSARLADLETESERRRQLGLPIDCPGFESADIGQEMP
jgi:hypothetical protein